VGLTVGLDAVGGPIAIMAELSQLLTSVTLVYDVFVPRSTQRTLSIILILTENVFLGMDFPSSEKTPTILHVQ
jgi:hypothetical protein